MLFLQGAARHNPASRRHANVYFGSMIANTFKSLLAYLRKDIWKIRARDIPGLKRYLIKVFKIGVLSRQTHARATPRRSRIAIR